MSRSAEAKEARIYDSVVPDWPGEIAFYEGLVAAAAAEGGAVLEVACGTGRVALRLARPGVRVVGLDRSAAMLAMARQKGAGMPDVRWVEADMRSFDLGESFALAMVPGHAFQHMLTGGDQLA
jgi:ubiquinone/menaquinone biosynthesis C-methylase UbiE